MSWGRGLQKAAPPYVACQRQTPQPWSLSSLILTLHLAHEARPQTVTKAPWNPSSGHPSVGLQIDPINNYTETPLALPGSEP